MQRMRPQKGRKLSTQKNNTKRCGHKLTSWEGFKCFRPHHWYNGPTMGIALSQFHPTSHPHNLFPSDRAPCHPPTFFSTFHAAVFENVFLPDFYMHYLSPHVSYMPHPAYPPWFHYTNKSGWPVFITKFKVIWYSILMTYFILLRSKYFPFPLYFQISVMYNTVYKYPLALIYYSFQSYYCKFRAGHSSRAV
jgi:hypothetical protein